MEVKKHESKISQPLSAMKEKVQPWVNPAMMMELTEMMREMIRSNEEMRNLVMNVDTKAMNAK
jgi:hypothetical protein